MFDKILRSAWETGAEVVVELRCVPGEYPMRGRVLDLDDEYFTLFHSGTSGGILWAFRRRDIACCGLVLELPEPLAHLHTGNEADPAGETANGPHVEPRSSQQEDGESFDCC